MILSLFVLFLLMSIVAYVYKGSLSRTSYFLVLIFYAFFFTGFSYIISIAL